MGCVRDLARPRTFSEGMVKFWTVCVFLSSVLISVPAFPFREPSVELGLPELPKVPVPHKRGRETVDAWSLCPPDMEQMDCFYTYLRLYARLRKASRETDRVSMRNIGKRGGQHAYAYLCDDAKNKYSCFTKLLKINSAHA